MKKYLLLILLTIVLAFSGCSSTTIIPNQLTDTIEIARGNVDNMHSIHKFGRNNNININSGFETIWNGGGQYTGFPATADTLEIFSNSASDTLLGTGARTVTIGFLLDENYTQMPDVTVNLSGLTPVSLGTIKYLRASRMRVISAGTSGINVGSITLRHTLTPTNVFAVMPAGFGSTMIAAYTVPANKTAFLTSWYGALSGKVNGISEIGLMVNPFNETFQVREELSLNSNANSYLQRTYPIYKNSIPEKSDIKIIADSSANGLGVAGGFDLILIDNS